jgi:hypothetical protein
VKVRTGEPGTGEETGERTGERRGELKTGERGTGELRIGEVELKMAVIDSWESAL